MSCIRPLFLCLVLFFLLVDKRGLSLRATVDPRSCEEFLCSDWSKCIPMHWFCDGERDCVDGSDEQAHCVPVSCTDEEFTCGSNRKCIPKKWRCDGTNDCDDLSDEKDCDSAKSCVAEKGYYHCTATNQCFAIKFLCDGTRHCSDGSDEGGFCNETCTPRLCGHECHATPTGPLCYCRQGYALDANNATCSDIDECAMDPPVCSHYCTNTAGSFWCSCASGYTLQADARRCLPTDATSPILLYSTQTQILRLSLKTKQHMVIQTHYNHPVDTAYDLQTNRVYWCDVEEKNVKSSSPKGKNVTAVIKMGLTTPESVDIDWVARRLYIVDSGSLKIIVCALDGAVCSILIDTDIDKPRSVVVDPHTGMLFWSDWGRKAKIERCGMDGQERKALVSTEIVWPNGLTLDYPLQAVYWVDASLDRLERVNMDGTNRMVVLAQNIHHPFSVAVFGDTVFWSDWFLGSIMAAQKFSGKNLQHIVDNLQQPLGLHIYHPVLQSLGTNHCAHNKCSHLCVLNMRKSYTCLCPDGTVLAANNHSCQDDLKTPYLLVARRQQIIRLCPATIGRRAEEVLPLTGLHNVVSLDFDWSSQALFYSDVSKDVIIRMQLNNTNNSRVIAYRNIGTVEGLAVDWIAKNIYWTDAQKSVIEVARLDGSTRRILIETDLEKPRGIAVDPLHGSLYFCDWGTHASIRHCDLAGVDCVYVAKNLGWPNNIVLDIAEARMYWTDAKIGIIESARFNGYDRRVISRKNPHPYSVSILRSTVFWTDWRTTSIHFADKQDGKNAGALDLNIADLMGIIAVTGDNQIQGENGCSKDNGGCTHLCLAKRAAMKYTCMCPPGMALSADQHTCTDSSQCGDSEFSCLDKCIPSVKLCDGKQDCPEGEDETVELCRVPCSDHESTCTNGACINKEWLCDGQNDCGDNSDEAGCASSVCLADQFMCDNGERCIPLEWQCDGQSECDDGTDEKDCETNTCAATEFRCNSGKCIPSTWYCDGDPDCEGVEDEVTGCNTGMSCGEGHWQCWNKRCIDEKWKCNGLNDCGDNSDELSCDYVQNDCTGNDVFLCLNGTGCIPANWTCDGEKDCEEGEDELNCTTLVTCEPTQFRCRQSAYCIPERWTCDGENDCDEGSDEDSELCGSKQPSSTTARLTSSSTAVPPGEKKCSDTSYECDNHECVALSKACDGKDDCYDSSDEGSMCSIACMFANAGCTDKCTATPKGAICHCHGGFRLLPDGKTCEDIDECAARPCSQYCVNTKGSFKCGCAEGYQLEPNGTVCKAKGPEAELLFTTEGNLRSLSLDGRQYTAVVADDTGLIQSIDFDFVHGTVYWNNLEDNTVRYLSESTNKAGILLRDTSSDGIAVDWVAANLYYTSLETPALWACTLQQGVCTPVVTDGVEKPRAVALYPSKGLMFWTDWGQHPFIQRSWMDGTHKMTIVRHNLVWPNGLTIDYVLDQLYWVDARMDTIQSADFTGSKRRTVVPNVYHPFSIVVFEDYIYWSDWAHRSVMRANKFTGSNQTTVQGNLRKPMDIKMRHPVRQPPGKNHCDAKKVACSHLCLLTPEGSTCACPVGMKLSLRNPTQCIGGTNIQPAELPTVAVIPPTIPKRKTPVTTTTTTTITSQPHRGVISSTPVSKVINPSPVMPVVEKKTTKAPPTFPAPPVEITRPSPVVPPNRVMGPPQKVTPVEHSIFTKVPYVNPKQPPFNPKRTPFNPKHTPFNPTRVPVKPKYPSIKPKYPPVIQKHPPFNPKQQPVYPTRVPVITEYPPFNPRLHPVNPTRRPILEGDHFTTLSSRPDEEPQAKPYPPHTSQTDPIVSVKAPSDKPRLSKSPVDGAAGWAGSDKGGLTAKSPDECGGCLNGGTCLPFRRSYRCSCPPQYSGPNCSKLINPIVERPLAASGGNHWVTWVVITLSCIMIVFVGLVIYFRQKRRRQSKNRVAAVQYHKAQTQDGASETNSFVNAYENPGFQPRTEDDEDMNANYPLTKQRLPAVYNSDESLESNFNSREVAIDVPDTKHLTPRPRISDK